MTMLKTNYVLGKGGKCLWIKVPGEGERDNKRVGEDEKWVEEKRVTKENEKEALKKSNKEVLFGGVKFGYVKDA